MFIMYIATGASIRFSDGGGGGGKSKKNLKFLAGLRVQVRYKNRKIENCVCLVIFLCQI